MKKLTTNWGSCEDKENLFFEIWCDDGVTSEEVAEISCEQSGSILIELMAPPKGAASWTLDFTELQKILSSNSVLDYFKKVSNEMKNDALG